MCISYNLCAKSFPLPQIINELHSLDACKKACASTRNDALKNVQSKSKFKLVHNSSKIVQREISQKYVQRFSNYYAQKTDKRKYFNGRLKRDDRTYKCALRIQTIIYFQLHIMCHYFPFNEIATK
jgi:hypothetical protein